MICLSWRLGPRFLRAHGKPQFAGICRGILLPGFPNSQQWREIWNLQPSMHFPRKKKEKACRLRRMPPSWCWCSSPPAAVPWTWTCPGDEVQIEASPGPLHRAVFKVEGCKIQKSQPGLKPLNVCHQYKNQGFKSTSKEPIQTTSTRTKGQFWSTWRVAKSRHRSDMKQSQG